MTEGWDSFFFFFALKSHSVKSTCCPASLCNAYWLMSGWLSGWWHRRRLWKKHHVTQSHLWVHLSTRYQGQTKATPSGKLVNTKVTGLRMHGGLLKCVHRHLLASPQKTVFEIPTEEYTSCYDNLKFQSWPLNSTGLSSMHLTGAMTVSRLSGKCVHTVRTSSILAPYSCVATVWI